jgi:hypothetical protein
MIHPINLHLPSTITQDNNNSLAKNDEENNLLIEQLFQQILNDSEIVNSKLYGKLLRLIEARFTMKYSMTVFFTLSPSFSF